LILMLQLVLASADEPTLAQRIEEWSALERA
jgi:hypothetical protein